MVCIDHRYFPVSFLFRFSFSRFHALEIFQSRSISAKMSFPPIFSVKEFKDPLHSITILSRISFCSFLSSSFGEKGRFLALDDGNFLFQPDIQPIVYAVLLAAIQLYTVQLIAILQETAGHHLVSAEPQIVLDYLFYHLVPLSRFAAPDLWDCFDMASFY